MFSLCVCVCVCVCVCIPCGLLLGGEKKKNTKNKKVTNYSDFIHADLTVPRANGIVTECDQSDNDLDTSVIFKRIQDKVRKKKIEYGK